MIEQDSGFMEGLSENIVCFELWHSVIESSWVDLDGLKGYEVLSLPMIHSGLQYWLDNITRRREYTKHTYQSDSLLSRGAKGGTVRADSFTLWQNH